MDGWGWGEGSPAVSVAMTDDLDSNPSARLAFTDAFQPLRTGRSLGKALQLLLEELLHRLALPSGASRQLVTRRVGDVADGDVHWHAWTTGLYWRRAPPGEHMLA